MQIVENKLNVAVIGLGVGNAHCESILQNYKKFNLIGVCDFDEDKLIKFRNLKVKYTTTKFNDILNAGDVDVMVIASFDEFHENQILSCLEKGIHLFVEKPICINRGQLNNITKKMAEFPNVRISSNLILRKENRFINLKERLQNDDLGEIYFVQCSYDYGRFYKIIDGWRGQQIGYSVVLGGAIHLIDLIYWATGQKFIPDALYSNNVTSTLNKLNFTDFKLGIGHLSGGAVATFSANYASNTKHHHEISIYGTKGVFVHSKGNTSYSFGGDLDNIIEDDVSAFPNTKKGDILNEFLSDLLFDTNTCTVQSGDVIEVMDIALRVEDAKNR